MNPYMHPSIHPSIHPSSHLPTYPTTHPLTHVSMFCKCHVYNHLPLTLRHLPSPPSPSPPHFCYFGLHTCPWFPPMLMPSLLLLLVPSLSLLVFQHFSITFAIPPTNVFTTISASPLPSLSTCLRLFYQHLRHHYYHCICYYFCHRCCHHCSTICPSASPLLVPSLIPSLPLPLLPPLVIIGFQHLIHHFQYHFDNHFCHYSHHRSCHHLSIFAHIYYQHLYEHGGHHFCHAHYRLVVITFPLLYQNVRSYFDRYLNHHFHPRFLLSLLVSFTMYSPSPRPSRLS